MGGANDRRVVDAMSKHDTLCGCEMCAPKFTRITDEHDKCECGAAKLKTDADCGYWCKIKIRERLDG